MFEPTHSIEDIVPEARPAFETLLKTAHSLGLSPSVGKHGAGRTCATQQMLKGMGPGVTGAGMCRSFHVIGRALDIDLYPSTCANYTKLGEFWESMGGTWGGRWTQFGACGDARHFQWSGGHGSVPESICPSDVSLKECEELRRAYLESEWVADDPVLAKLGVGLFATGTVALAYILWRAYAGKR